MIKLLCKIIGHRWVESMDLHVDDFCYRCGKKKPSPFDLFEELMNDKELVIKSAKSSAIKQKEIREHVDN